MIMTGPVLFCYDGSDGSRGALTDAGALLKHDVATVVTVWETLATRLATTGGLALAYIPDQGDLDAQEEAAARQAAELGVTIATQRGWEASARVENARVCVWRTLIEVADEIDAAVIVCGARGRNAAKRVLLGSVAEAVLHHSHRPTLIAPEVPRG